jgi:hypothetical protein
MRHGFERAMPPCLIQVQSLHWCGASAVSAPLTNVVTLSRQSVVDYGKHPLVRVADKNEAAGPRATALSRSESSRIG